jgi:hypothetical protein
MKAIRTKYYGSTNTKGSRLIASDGDGNSITIPYPHECNIENAHRFAAEALCKKMGWSTALVSGWFKNECYWVFK